MAMVAAAERLMTNRRPIELRIFDSCEFETRGLLRPIQIESFDEDLSCQLSLNSAR